MTMTSLLVGLVALALAVLVQSLALRSRARSLRIQEQAFRFHAIRDELQLLALRGDVAQSGELYQILMWTSNLAIHNAGEARLRDMVRLARVVDPRMAVVQELLDMKRHPKALQKLAAETFNALTMMLIVNDWLVLGGLRFAQFTWQTWKVCQPVARGVIATMDWIADLLSPPRAEAVRYARKYDRSASDLAAI